MPVPVMIGLSVCDDDAGMTLALQQAAAAERHHDVPVGAVVVRNGAVIAARHNERELTGDPTAHAEILAIRDAARAIGHWRLENCSLYVTLEPCAMCAGAAVNSRVARVVYGATDPKAGAGGSLFNLLADPRLNHRCEISSGVLAEECGSILKAFFTVRRKTPTDSAAADAVDQAAQGASTSGGDRCGDGV